LLQPGPQPDTSPPITIEETIVVEKLILRLVLAIAFVYGILPVYAQDFSATLVRLKPASDLKTKMYGHADKFRFEITGQQRSSIAIIDLETRTTLMVIPDNKSYVKSPHVSASIPLFRVTDAENACPAWKKSLEKPGTCAKVGNETIDGRSTVKYKGTASDGDTGYAWVDRRLKLVIKWQGERGAAALENIQEGPQEASLFKPPPGYEMFDLAAQQQAARQKKRSKPPQPGNTPPR
jgi:hypothetical protein